MVGIQTAETPKTALLPRRAHAAMKFPIKVQLRRTFIPLLLDACPEPPLPCKGEGVIQIGFLGNQFGI